MTAVDGAASPAWNSQAEDILCRELALLKLSPLTEQQKQQFAIYANFLVAYNRKVNLTRITDPVGIALKHFADSLSILRVITLTPGMKIIDIGSGAGFPGVPMLIVHPEVEMTLLDATAKRLKFLAELLPLLELRATLLHQRAEEAERQPHHRGSYQVAVARGVASLPRLLEYAIPFLAKGGRFVAPKGPGGAAELLQAQEALRRLGARHLLTDTFSLDATGEPSERQLLVFRRG
ncbi:MAG: 16S rRNA (guanine(527)-N(7))-methyltransferase RsmG [Symbiobacteriaceae bacterium]|nr:16S rRNA (guanine(527)-N(7))-methyltransferase RsmG [Symbiobacteriaceae bacterium]